MLQPESFQRRGIVIDAGGRIAFECANIILPRRSRISRKIVSDNRDSFPGIDGGTAAAQPIVV
ncbi:MAG: hypothetical protein R3C26_15890 [Calditrichia bacterium]